MQNKIKRSFLKFKSYFNSLTINKTRFWLTLIGLIIGTVFFSLCIIYMSTYKYSNEIKYENFDDNLIIIRNNLNFEEEDLKYIEDNISNDSLISYSTKNVLKSSDSDEKNHIQARYIINGIKGDFIENFSVANTNINSAAEMKYNAIVNKNNLIHEVTDFQNKFNELENNILINEYGANLLFGHTNVIGQKVTFPNTTDEYKIIGVLENSSVVNNSINTYNKALSKYKKGNSDINIYDYSPRINIYLNTQIYEKNFITIGENIIEKISIKAKNENEFKQDLKKLEDYFNATSSDNNYVFNISTRESIDNTLEKAYKSGEEFLMIGFIIIIFITGFSIMNTMFFNVKEKFSEIGIRQAMGANKRDILIQFLFEGSIYGIFAFILSIIISIIISQIYTLIHYFNNLDNFYVKYDIKDFLFIFVAIVIGTSLFTIIPAIKASRMKIIDSIKFE